MKKESKKLNKNTKIVSESQVSLGDILAFIRENQNPGDNVDVIADAVIAKLGRAGVVMPDNSGKPVTGTVAGNGVRVDVAISSSDAARGDFVGYSDSATQQTVGNIGTWCGSKYFRKVLANGEVFCPYTDRRFLPAQYMRMMRRYNGNVDRGIAQMYSLKRVWKLFEYEVNNLAWMRDSWRLAYDERCMFFSPQTCRDIIREYLTALRENLNDKSRTCYARRRKEYFRNIPGFGHTILWTVTDTHTDGGSVVRDVHEVRASNWLSAMNRDIDSCLERCRAATCYERIADVVRNMPKVDMGMYFGTDGEMRFWQPVSWRKAFKKAGAYYTLKSLIRDGLVKFSSDDTGKVGSVACGLRELRGLARYDVPAYVVHAILKKSVEDSKFNMNRFLDQLSRC